VGQRSAPLLIGRGAAASIRQRETNGVAEIFSGHRPTLNNDMMEQATWRKASTKKTTAARKKNEKYSIHCR